MDQPTWPDRSWVTSAELAEIAVVNGRTILREIERGHLAAKRSGGYVIDLDEAKRWLDGFSPYSSLRQPRPRETP